MGQTIPGTIEHDMELMANYFRGKEIQHCDEAHNIQFSGDALMTGYYQGMTDAYGICAYEIRGYLRERGFEVRSGFDPTMVDEYKACRAALKGETDGHTA